MDISVKTAAARGFVRSLNILLKFARMYDFGHPRTAAQYETAWKELRTALGDNESGLLLAASGDKLLLDGVALESAAAEKSFARLLSSAGIASIHFSPKVTQASLGRLVKAFPSGSGARPESLAEQLKTALEDAPGIHVNEVCFVPADSAVAKGQVAASITAATLGLDSEQCNELFKDPRMLLQLIAAAEGSRGGGGGFGGPGGSGPGGSGSGGSGGPGGSGGHGGSGGSRGHGSGGSGPGGRGAGAGSGGASDVRGGGQEGSGENPGDISGGGSNTPPGGGFAGPAGSNAGAGNSNGTSAGPSGSQGSANRTQVAAPGEAGPAGFPGPMPNPSGVGGPSGNVQYDSGTVTIPSPSSSSGVPRSNSGSAREPGDANPDAHPSGGHYSGIDTPIESNWSALTNFGSGTDQAPGSHGQPGGRGGFFSGGEGAVPGRWANATASLRTPVGSGSSGHGVSVADAGILTFEEEEVQGILKVLAQIAGSKEGADSIQSSAFQSRLSTLPRRARFTLSQALSAMAAQATAEKPDQQMLLKVAEHVAVRYALESYERGDIRVNAIQETLERMSKEVESLRKVLGVHEERMARAGMRVSSHAEILAQQFWKEVPVEKKHSALLSSNAWCVPAHSIREYLDQLKKEGKTETIVEILRNYAAGIQSPDAKIRRATAIGLAEVANFYAGSDDRLFVETIRDTGLQLSQETEPELQSLVSAAFVRLAQEATQKRSYPAIQRAIELVDFVEQERPGLGNNLRPRIAVENRLPEFIEEALKAPAVPDDLTSFLRRIPKAAAEHLATRFTRCGFREECDRLLDMMRRLGPEANEHVRSIFQKAPSQEALDVVGMITRLDPQLAEQVLPGRLDEWKRLAHDRVVRQIASSGASERGRLLLAIFDRLDPLIRPLAVDEIGLSGEQSGNLRLVRLAEGDLPADSTKYLQLKAVEAIGRLRTAGSEMVLRRILEARQVWRWMFPLELRIVAAQAMSKIDPEFVKNYLPRSGLNIADFSLEPLDPDPNSACMRQRRYMRLRLDEPLSGTTLNLKENCQLEIPEMNLAGGVALSDQRMHPGALVSLKLSPNGKAVKAQAIVRDANTQARAFELVDIELEERAKLRRLLIQLGNALSTASPENRSRNRGRTIVLSSNS